jgi:hypothetical protein
MADQTPLCDGEPGYPGTVHGVAYGCPGCPACRVRCGGKPGEAGRCSGCRDCLKCERCGGDGIDPTSGLDAQNCSRCGGSGIEASGERTERDEQESGKDAEARTVARRRACGWSQRDETGLDVLMVVPAESLAPEQRPCGVCGGPVEQLEGGAWVCVRRCAIPAPAVPEEGERWKITICNSCGRVADRAADGSAYCRWSQRHNPVNGGTFNQIMVVPEARATQAERERDELRKALRRIIADDTYATKIARTALHPQDSTERTDDA